jgi:hypothetical protein
MREMLGNKTDLWPPAIQAAAVAQDEAEAAMVVDWARPVAESARDAAVPEVQDWIYPP